MNTKIIKIDNFKIRYVEIENNKWFIAKDICKILNLNNVTSALKNIEKNHKKYHIIDTCDSVCTPSTTRVRKRQNMNIIILDGIKKMLQSCRSINKDKIISILNIELNVIYDCKESSYLRVISSSFKRFSQIFQHQIGLYKIDLYFPEYKLAIEVDEFGHEDRCPIYEQNRQEYLEKYLKCKFIRFNPDETNFNIGDVISIIMNEIFERGLEN